MMNEYCPFCEKSGFDLVSLKLHLIKGECEVFNELPVLDLSAD